MPLEARLTLKDGTEVYVDFLQPLDISLPLKDGYPQVNCFHAPLFRTEPVKAGDFVGSIAAGGIINFKNVFLNPHGNGTHTECVGHISKEPYTIHQCLQRYVFWAQVVSVYPTLTDEGDRVILPSAFEGVQWFEDATAFVLRTLPNLSEKQTFNYSNSNPPYLHADTVAYLLEQGMEHLLVDLPSVDREEDGAAFAAHKAFWDYPNNPRTERSITELIFVPDSIQDGNYLLQLQIISIEMDASPSKPILYPIEYPT